MHMAIGAVLNAAWDLLARERGDAAVGRYIASLTVEELVDQVDFRHISDALSAETRRWTILDAASPGGQNDRVARLLD